MNAGKHDGIQIDGDVVGQVVVGDHNVVVKATGSLVTVMQPGTRPHPIRRTRIRLLPRHLGVPLGREAESSIVAASVAAGEPAQVLGAEGVGKSRLVRHLAHEIGDGVVFLNGRGKDVDDLLQDTFEACYDSSGYRPSDIELRRLMADVHMCLMVDDFAGSPQELTRLWDLVPSGAIILTSRDRVLWGHGRVVGLTGLTREPSLDLLASHLGRPLRPADTPVANALWEAADGNPLRLVQAAALAQPSVHGELVLPKAGDVPALLAQLLERVAGIDREILALLAAAPQAEIALDLVGLMLAAEIKSAADRLVSSGLVVQSEHRVRLSTTAASAIPAVTGTQLEQIASRLVTWVSARDTPPETVAAHAELITAVVDALGKADLGVRLARAAAPVVACSLRWGAWRRVLNRGLAAATRAGDAHARAYFTHEEGIRLLLIGKLALAAGALAAAGAMWTALGHHAEAQTAGHAQTLADPAGQAHAALDGTTQTSPDAASHVDAAAPSPTREQLVGTQHSTSGATTAAVAKPGLSLTAKLVIGGSLLAAVGGGIVFSQTTGSQGDTASVPLRVTVMTDLIEVDMPGDPDGPCPTGTGKTKCTKVVRAARGQKGPVQVVPAGPLPPGVAIVYWGCQEGPAAKSCTVLADQERTVCATTTSPADDGARKQCETLTAHSGQAATTSRVPSPWALIATVWSRDDGAIFDFDGQEAHWVPADDNILTTCKQTVPDLNSKTELTMNCSDLDRKWTAFISLSTIGGLEDANRILTITGDSALSGNYRAKLRFVGPTDVPSAPPTTPDGMVPPFDPCLLTSEDLALAGPFLKTLDVKQRWGVDSSRSSTGPFFGMCWYRDSVHDRPVSGEVQVRLEVTQDGDVPPDICQPVDITQHSWYCTAAHENRVFVHLAGGTTITVDVAQFGGKDSEELTTQAEKAAVIALTKTIVARI